MVLYKYRFVVFDKVFVKRNIDAICYALSDDLLSLKNRSYQYYGNATFHSHKIGCLCVR